MTHGGTVDRSWAITTLAMTTTERKMRESDPGR
jgi:hypothetical protein